MSTEVQTIAQSPREAGSLAVKLAQARKQVTESYERYVGLSPQEALRDELAEDWKPRNRIERRLIDSMAQSLTAKEFWSKRLVFLDSYVRFSRNMELFHARRKQPSWTVANFIARQQVVHQSKSFLQHPLENNLANWVGSQQMSGVKVASGGLKLGCRWCVT